MSVDPTAVVPERGEAAVATVEAVTDQLARTLGGWAAANVMAGLPLWAAGRAARQPWLAGIGRQAVGWGLVNAAIAAVADRPSARPPAAGRLRRVLLANTAADVAYVLGGLALASGRLPWGRTRTARARGDGLGIVVQGGFLLRLDAMAARALQTAARQSEQTRPSGAGSGGTDRVA